jgi:hypothetical protein
MRRHAEGFLKFPIQVSFRQSGGAGQIRAGDLLPKVSPDVFDGLGDAHKRAVQGSRAFQ